MQHFINIITRMSSHSQKIEEKIKQLEQVADKLKEEAKQNLAKAQACKGAQRQMYKNKALMALSKKKQYQNQIVAYMNQQMTLDKMKFTTENIKSHQQMVKIMQPQIGTLEHAVKEQKQAIQSVDVDRLADLQDQMMDMKFEAGYVNELMSRNYELDVDEDELDDELAEFEREIARDKKKVVVGGQKNPMQSASSSKDQDIESMLKGL